MKVRNLLRRLALALGSGIRVVTPNQEVPAPLLERHNANVRNLIRETIRSTRLKASDVSDPENWMFALKRPDDFSLPQIDGEGVEAVDWLSKVANARRTNSKDRSITRYE